MLDSVESRGVNGSRDGLGSESRLAVEEGVFKASEPLGELIFPPFLEETFEMMSSIVHPGTGVSVAVLLSCTLSASRATRYTSS